jgi:hypothetical protein
MRRLLACAAVLALALVLSGATVKVSTHDKANADGSLNSAYPLDSAPAVIAWDNSCLTTALSPIASQSIVTTTAIAIDTASTCLTGSLAPAATLSFVQAADGITACAPQWSVAGTSPNRYLSDTGPSAGAGSCKLKAVYQSLTALSNAYPWNYTGLPADALAPPIPTDLKITNLPTSVTITGEVSWDACGVSTCKGAQDIQIQKDGSGTLATIAVGTGFSCSPVLTNVGAMATTPTATQTGNDWAMAAAGTLDTTADAAAFVNCAFNGPGFVVNCVASIGATPANYRKDVVARRESQNVPGSREIYAGFEITDIGEIYTFVDARITTDGLRQHLTTATLVTLPACVKLQWDSNNLHTVSTSSMTSGKSNNDWTVQLAGYSLTMPTTTYVGQMVTSTTGSSGAAVSVSNTQLNINNLARVSYNDVTTGAHTYAFRERDQVPNASAYSPTVTGVPTGAGNTAIKFQPGWYAIYNTSCSVGNALCESAVIVSTINSEICPNANLVGLKLNVAPAYLIPDTAGVYTGNSGQGFTAIDAVVAALRSCGKYLMLETTQGWFGDFGPPNQMVPAFTYPASGCGLYTCVNGTATGSNYGVVTNSQSSQAGFSAKLWQDDWRDLAIAATTAYCTRYDSNPAFYSIGIIYYNTSLPFATDPVGYTEAGFNTQFRTYLTAARAACPNTNVEMLLDYVGAFPALVSTNLAHLQTTHAAMTNSDTWITYTGGATHGQRGYSGADGSPSLIDYRGALRNFEAVETPDMCGSRQTATPAQIFSVHQNGNAGNRARWPSHIMISMATECDSAGTGWAAWKAFIASINGYVMNGRNSTLRAPAEVKALYCESSMSCP